LLGVAALGVVDALFCGIDIDQSPADSSAKNLAERLCRLEAMPAADVHAPGRDLGGAKLVDPPVSERPHRLREQPAQLRDGLGLAAVLRQVEINELAQPWCLDEALLAVAARVLAQAPRVRPVRF